MEKRIIRLVSIFVLLMFLPSVSLAQGFVVTRFSDVPETYWGYPTIMQMTKAGLFKGTTEPVNGVGTFDPEKTMTRAEFLTAALRAVYPEAAENVQNVPGQWWLGYYHQALKYGLLFPSELENGVMNSPMTREEMAMLMVRCVERMGESIEQEVDESQIADYWSISNSYKGYVRTCFSFGLLGGVDSKGTYAPHKSLTRAEAATVLCRLLDKDMRLKVDFPKENVRPTLGNNSNNNHSGNNSPSGQKPSGGNNSPNTETTKVYPWDKGGKQPSSYTWEEFMDLSEEDQLGFLEWFESVDAFRDWQNRVLNDDGSWNDKESYPWEEGGKSPSEYTWDEFCALSPSEQEAFFEWFDTPDAFEEWSDAVQGKEDAPSDSLPWEDDGKSPSEYTWDEFCKLSAGEQEAFFNWFDSADAFEAWMNEVQGGGSTSEENYPWEEGGKQPSSYSWEEFLELNEEEQEAFFNWFGSADAFEEWQNNVLDDRSDTEESYPWEEGGKQPSSYSWEEFMDLSEEEQEAFFDWFGSADAFEDWMNEVQS